MHCYILNIEAAVFMVSEDCFKSYSSLYGTSMEAYDTQGVTNLKSRGMVGMIYVGDYQTLRKAVLFIVRSYSYCLCELLVSRCMTSLRPMGLDW